MHPGALRISCESARSASPSSDGLSLMTPFRGNAARSAAVQQIGAE